MKKEITKKQILKGIGLWIVIIAIAVVTFANLVKIANPYYIPEKQLEQIRVEEGI